VVIKAGTGEPLRKATVAANPSGGRSEGGTAETDAMGRFELKGLAPGRYRLSAQRNGFVRQEYGQRTPDGPGAVVTLSPGQKVSDITFPMIPAAAITGHVYDEDGEPVLYAQVMAMHYVYTDGQRLLRGSASGQTNDLGEFRLFGLSPGQYLVQAMPRPGGPKQVYLPVYYPGVSDAGRAAPIALHGGDAFSGVDISISLQPLRTFAVRGNVLNAGCGASANGAMVFIGEQNPTRNLGMRISNHPADVQGAFEFSSVIPGSYYVLSTLNERGLQCAGLQAVEVVDADIDGVSVALTPGVEIKGRLRAEGQSDFNPGSIAVTLTDKSRHLPGAHGPVEPDGSFLLKKAYDGDYEISVENLPENYFVKSARMGGMDVLHAGITVDTKQSPGALEIVASSSGASVDGVISKDEQPFEGATVALVPDPPHRGEERLFKSATTDQKGHFILEGVSPGDYKVFAWEEIEAGAYTNPDFLQPFEVRGESAHVAEGAHVTVNLELIPKTDVVE
jgi:hypothetical protein